MTTADFPSVGSDVEPSTLLLAVSRAPGPTDDTDTEVQMLLRLVRPDSIASARFRGHDHPELIASEQLANALEAAGEQLPADLTQRERELLDAFARAVAAALRQP